MVIVHYIHIIQPDTLHFAVESAVSRFQLVADNGRQHVEILHLLHSSVRMLYSIFIYIFFFCQDVRSSFLQLLHSVWFSYACVFFFLKFTSIVFLLPTIFLRYFNLQRHLLVLYYFFLFLLKKSPFLGRPYWWYFK